MSSPPVIPEDKREIILGKLVGIEREHGVRILFAIESGSRAWGFPSPDSDYDVRFVYVHPPAWYVALDARRDVIELPIEGDLDINGWDLRKALQLLLKANAVLLEWLRSPIVYRADREAMGRIAELGERVAHLRPSIFHYAHLAHSQYRRYIACRETVALKKYFYSLRPALALMWLRRHPDRAVPMSLAELRAGLELPVELSAFLDELLARKARTKELGEGPRIAALDGFVEAELRLAGDDPREGVAPPPELMEMANRVFRDLAGMA